MRLTSFYISKNKVSTKDVRGPPAKAFNDYPYCKVLQKKLYGRRFLLQQLNIEEEKVKNHVKHRYVKLEQSIITSNQTPFCVRCGNIQKHLFGKYPCAKCKKTCLYCRKCIMYGRVSECSILISWCGPELESKGNKPILAWEGTLSDGQSYAANKIVEAIKKEKSLLVWAVCGAGKTELLFQGLHYALIEGKKVCIASPRVDVIHELTPRLKKEFPNTHILSLYGGSDDRRELSNFVIATTHQLLHYYKCFEVIVIDEVDAFPFEFDKMLDHAVQNAKSDNCSIIYLSATPKEKLIKTVNTIKISARYHANPLPVPSFKWIGNWHKKLNKNRIPLKVVDWLKNKILDDWRVLLFVPSVNVMKQVVQILQSYSIQVDSVHAKDKSRKEKVNKLRSGDIQVLVTTTILERGVTIPKLHVAVLGAEDNIFTESALVQIAGRVGRSKEYPIGDVIYFHYGRTKAMSAAKKHILSMNTIARKEGYLIE